MGVAATVHVVSDRAQMDYLLTYIPAHALIDVNSRYTDIPYLIDYCMISEFGQKASYVNL
jgi:hypothetical protein